MANRSGLEHVAVVSNPEFLREGSAVVDFMNPDRLVLGSSDPDAVDRVASLYRDLNAPIQRVDIRTAEMIKYASNAFLATKISFINEMATICEALGADIAQVARGMGMDPRIGSQFLHAGLGWGGSCFPKDVRALAHTAAVHGAHPQLLRSVLEINSDQRLRALQKVRQSLGGVEGRAILVLGAAFKANTDDIRNSPALELASLLALEGADVRIHDPVVSPGRISDAVPGVRVVEDLGEGADGASALVLATDWPLYTSYDYARLAPVMRHRVMIDTRNCLEPAVLNRAGFSYQCIGRPAFERKPADSTRLLFAGGD
jgi:UDPglucose 6-dehydrogenase